jgi:hypothetical protein
MGIECFNLRIICSSSFEEANRFLRGPLGLTDDQTHHSTHDDVFLQYEDADHIIECETMRDGPRVQISLRFALCVRITVDTIMIGLTSRIVSSLGGSVVIGGISAEPRDWGHDPSSINDAIRDIEDCRRTWRGLFGDSTEKLRCAAALSKYVMT